MGLRETVKQRALEMMGGPRVVLFLQNPRVANALVSLVKGVGSLDTAIRGGGRRVARSLGLASARELEALERRVARAEEEASRLARRIEDVEKP